MGEQGVLDVASRDTQSSFEYKSFNACSRHIHWKAGFVIGMKMGTVFGTSTQRDNKRVVFHLI